MTKNWIDYPNTTTPLSAAAMEDLEERVTMGAINVKDAPYNATGNGATDDTTAIQTALDDSPGGGGKIVFPPGTYRFTNLTVLENTRLIGTGGWGQSVLMRIAGSTGSGIKHDASLEGSDWLGGVTFEGLMIDGYGCEADVVQLGGYDGTPAWSSGALMRDCQVYNSVALSSRSTNTTLAEDLDTTETEIDLTSAAAFPTSGRVVIGAVGSKREIVNYTGKSGNTLTGCTRNTVHSITNTGAGASHSSGARVELGPWAALYAYCNVARIDNTYLQSAGIGLAAEGGGLYTDGLVLQDNYHSYLMGGCYMSRFDKNHLEINADFDGYAALWNAGGSCSFNGVNCWMDGGAGNVPHFLATYGVSGITIMDAHVWPLGGGGTPTNMITQEDAVVFDYADTHNGKIAFFTDTNTRTPVKAQLLPMSVASASANLYSLFRDASNSGILSYKDGAGNTHALY